MSLAFSRINEARGQDMPELHEMRQRHVEPDGNCLFRAASVALSRNFKMLKHAEDESARRLRGEVIRFMRLNKASFESFMREGQDFDEYLRNMSNERVWGGELEVSAIARLHRRPVHVYIRTETKYVLLSQYPAGSEGCGDKISLLFHGQHYDALFE
jgi:hypothetical protein